LPADYTKTDGTAYLSGTEWEYHDAITAREGFGKPTVWVYRRNQVPALNLEDPEFDEKRRQWQKVKDFFQTFVGKDDSLIGGVNTYQTPDEFRRKFEQHLRDRLTVVLEEMPEEGPKESLPQEMAGIFISYARKDLEKVRPLAKALERKGWSVWWDPNIPPGKDFDDVIEEELSIAGCVIVIWSKKSVKSKYVKGEAREGLKRGILVPIAIESSIKPPLDFRSTQTVSLIDWDGSEQSPEFGRIIDGIEAILGRSAMDVTEAERKSEEREESRRKAEEEQKREGLVQRAKEVTKAKPGEDKPTITVPIAPRTKSLAFGIGAVALIIILSGIGWFLYSGDKGTVQTKSFENSIGMQFVYIKPGTFMMGSHIGLDETVRKYGGDAKLYKVEHPQHEVTISKPFYLQSTEVTQWQWERVMGNNPSFFKECGDGCPVEAVSWDDAQKFIKKLNEMEGTDKYRLPTEAEWEYAARAGTTTAFSFEGDISKLNEYAWYSDNSEGKTHPVGEKKPNAWGLYDMHGNVYEWVEDDWHDNYDGAPDDGRAWVDDPRGASRVMRGGGCRSDAHYCRSARRDNWPGYRYNLVGFRLSRSVALDP
jgi:formylglycine-generating enzyme required for sulfatase activity